MRTYRQKLDAETVQLTSYGLSCRYGVYNIVKYVNDRAPDKILNQIYEESRHDYEIDLPRVYSSTINADKYQIDIPMYHGFIPFKVKFTVHVQFDATTKLGIFTDTAVLYIFDLCGPNDSPLAPGVYDLIFLPDLETTYPEIYGALVDNAAVITQNGDFKYINMYGAQSHVESLVNFYAVKKPIDESSYETRICPEVINVVGEQIKSDGTHVPQYAHVRVFGNTSESAFGSLEVEVFPMYTDIPEASSEWDTHTP